MESSSTKLRDTFSASHGRIPFPLKKSCTRAMSRARLPLNPIAPSPRKEAVSSARACSPDMRVASASSSLHSATASLSSSCDTCCLGGSSSSPTLPSAPPAIALDIRDANRPCPHTRPLDSALLDWLRVERALCSLVQARITTVETILMLVLCPATLQVDVAEAEPDSLMSGNLLDTKHCAAALGAPARIITVVAQQLVMSVFATLYVSYEDISPPLSKENLPSPQRLELFLLTSCATWSTCDK
mmetsp:Transcript_20029/g.32480  ORF Transcript_20029/g.32480 Transcript_20029/m.32480 type:complete len:244 (+) Transcript_20029:572-1303(+)